MCYCEHKNGGKGKNGLICKIDEKFEKSGSCAVDEWCVGPSDEEEATNRQETLCMKG